MKSRRIIPLLIVVMLSLIVFATPVFAVENSIGSGVATTSNESIFSDYGDISTPDELLGQTGDVVTVDEASDWVDRKGGEIITIVQHALRPVCIVGFFLCIFLIVAGALGNGRMLVGGIIGLFVCGISFTLVTCGPQIVQAFTSWLMS